MYFIIAALLIAIFLKSHDLVIKQLAFYIALYVLMVVFTELIFGMGFSPQAERFEDNTTIITILLILFCAPFLVRFNHRSSIGPVDFYKAYSMSYEAFIFFIATPLFLGMLYLLLTNGVRLTSGFEDHVGDRNIMVDYMYVYYVSILAVFRRSKVLFLLGVLSFTVHFLAAERMRAFVYVLTILITYFDLYERRKLSSAVLLMGFGMATVVGLLRSTNINTEYNVTHFGSVTISSYYLLEFEELLSKSQKLFYSVGTIAASIVPSSIIPAELNIRKAIYNYADIPGGGWTPVYIFITSGFLGVFVTGWLSSSLYFSALRVLNGKYVPYYYAPLVIFVSTCPRWFMYTPFQLIKMPLYGLLLSFTLFNLLRLIDGRSKKAT